MPESKSGALPLGDSPAENRRVPNARSGPDRENRAEGHANTGQRMPRERPRDEARRIRGGRAASAARACSDGERCEHAGARTGHPRVRRSACASACSATAMSGMPGRRDRLQIVPTITLGKDVHFRRRRCFVSIPARRRSTPSAPRPAGTTTVTHSGGSDTGVRRSPTPRASAGVAADEERHVGAEPRRRSAPAHRARQVQCPTAGSAPAAPTPRRNCRRPVRRPAGSA